VQLPLVQDLADFMPSGSLLFIQSDILDVATEMRDRFAANGVFTPQATDWMPINPMPLPTEREVSVLQKGEPVYRMSFVRQ
jgi:tRNA (guanine-N7-)-methyltransferase